MLATVTNHAQPRRKEYDKNDFELIIPVFPVGQEPHSRFSTLKIDAYTQINMFKYIKCIGEYDIYNVEPVYYSPRALDDQIDYLKITLLSSIILSELIPTFDHNISVTICS